MGNVFYTSDPHWGHRLVAEHRGFADVQDHDRRLFAMWESMVGADDLVWVLGDLAASSPGYALQLMSELPGRKRLVWGNHDKGHPMYRDAWKDAQKYASVFEWAGPFARQKLDNVDFLMSHFPYRADRGEPRFTQYRLRDEGMPLLHGHLHLPVRNVSDRELHVGLDAWGMELVPQETVIRFLNGDDVSGQDVGDMLETSIP